MKTFQQHVNPVTEAAKFSAKLGLKAAADSESEYSMPKTVELKNFRGYQNAQLTDCKRINVIVGDNGSGKTAFLEAIFIATGASPELALRVRHWRGIDNTQVGGLSRRQLVDAVWGDLFYDFGDSGAAVEIKLTGGGEYHTRSLRIESHVDTSARITLPNVRDEIMQHDQPELVTFNWSGPKGYKSQASMSIVEGKVSVSGVKESRLQTAFFAANNAYSSGESASRYSQLSQVGNEGAVVEAIRLHYPWVKSISIELLAGVPLLFAKVEGRRHKMPLNMLSGGMNKLAAILFTIPTSEHGVILIDEIENGFYYEKYPTIWSTLLTMADEYDVQLFISTHNHECLAAAAKLAEKNPDMFSLVRTIRTDKGCVLKHFDAGHFVSALESNVEIR